MVGKSEGKRALGRPRGRWDILHLLSLKYETVISLTQLTYIS
jgi:hypothetical protein